MLLVAQFAIGIEYEGVTGLQDNFVVLESADADFWPLQIGEDADRAVHFFRELAHQIGPRDVVFWFAVRKIHAHDIDTGFDQPFQHVWCGGSGTEGGNNFGGAWHNNFLFFSFHTS